MPMLPRDLKSEQFADYPPEARKLVTNYLGTIQQLPLSFLPSLLREIIEYDFKFPAERQAREKELKYISSLSRTQLGDCFAEFEQIRLSPQLQSSDWTNAPAQFIEQLSEHLWRTHQIDAFRQASNYYAERLEAATPPDRPPVPRLGIAVVGQGVDSDSAPLFRKLRPHGAYFSRVKPENGLRLLLDAMASRAKAHPIPYAHWYIDGGVPAEHDPALTSVSYSALEPVRTALLRK